MYAVGSNRVPQAALLPPESPRIGVWYLAGIDSPFRFHRNCLVVGGAPLWLSTAERVYTSDEDQNHDLVTYKKTLVSPLRERAILFCIVCRTR